MSSHQTSNKEEKCAPCQFVRDRIPQICNYFSGDKEKCKQLMDKFRSGDITNEEAVNELMEQFDETTMSGLRRWASDLKKEMDDYYGDPQSEESNSQD